MREIVSRNYVPIYRTSSFNCILNIKTQFHVQLFPILLQFSRGNDIVFIEKYFNPSGTKGGGSKTTPLGFSSVVFARGMILKRNFG